MFLARRKRAWRWRQRFERFRLIGAGAGDEAGHALPLMDGLKIISVVVSVGCAVSGSIRVVPDSNAFTSGAHPANCTPTMFGMRSITPASNKSLKPFHEPSVAALVAERQHHRTRAEFEGLLDKIIACLMKMLTRSGYLVEDQGVSYIADIDADNPLASLQAASCTYRIALGPRAG